MAKIERITAVETFDTSATPTIETTVYLSDGTIAKSSVATGTKRGTYEMHSLRDNDPERFFGQGVLKAVDAVNATIAPKLVGIESYEQQKIDKILLEIDGTQNKTSLGGNSLLSVSQAVCKAAAKSALVPLFMYLRQLSNIKSASGRMPIPMFNILEGGKHVENGLDFQEFLVIPASSSSLVQSMEIGVSVYKKMKEFLKNNNLSYLSSIEGGFAPAYTTNIDALKALKSVIESTKYAYSRDVFTGIDVAANSLINNKKYNLKDKNGQLDSQDMTEIYQQIINDFSSVYFEDVFAEDDWDAWKKLYPLFSSKALIAGDELTSTNPYRLQSALQNNVINAIVLKPTQIGTVTETLAVAEIARFKQLKIIVSGRSSETDDTFISDFAIAIQADYVKFGAPARERISKYNRLLEIQNQISDNKLL